MAVRFRIFIECDDIATLNLITVEINAKEKFSVVSVLRKFGECFGNY